MLAFQPTIGAGMPGRKVHKGPGRTVVVAPSPATSRVAATALAPFRWLR